MAAGGAHMRIRNAQYRKRVAAIIEDAEFIRLLGLQLGDTGPGWCETRLPLADHHRQQDGHVHAGVQATMADHTAGCAAFTLVEAEQIVLTAEFKINLLRPAHGRLLTCRAEVLRAGRSLTVAESWVMADSGDGDGELCAKATVTLAVVPQPPFVDGPAHRANP